MLPFFEKKDTELFVFEYSNFAFAAHFHPSIEIISAQSGMIGIVTEGERHLLHEGEIGVIFPNRVHRYEYIQNTNSKGYLMLIGPKLMGEYRRETEERMPKNPIIKRDELDGDCIGAMEKLRHMENAPLRMQRAYAEMVLCHLFDKTETIPSAKCEEETLYRLVDYMEKHFCENISLESVAEALYVNKYSLSRIFASQLGMSFNDYLNNLRVRRAAELLDKGEKISATAFEAGFNNLRTFNRAFAKIMQKTPTEYIKKC